MTQPEAGVASVPASGEMQRRGQANVDCAASGDGVLWRWRALSSVSHADDPARSSFAHAAARPRRTTGYVLGRLLSPAPVRWRGPAWAWETTREAESAPERRG